MPRPDIGPCTPTGAATLYRINALSIPTPMQANNGDIVGHNVDGRGDVCGVPDYAGGVDNSLIDLAAALPSLAPDDPIDLQAEIDNALACAPDATDCTRLDLIVSVATASDCVQISVLDGAGTDATTLAGPFVGSLDGSGNMRGFVPSLALSIPFATDTGSVDISLSVSDVILTGTRSDTALTNVVIGGALIKADFEQTIMDLLPQLGGDITFDDIGPILANLYDVQVAGGACEALSVGLTASAVVVAAP
jgi:hypothetical protein